MTLILYASSVSSICVCVKVIPSFPASCLHQPPSEQPYLTQSCVESKSSKTNDDQTDNNSSREDGDVVIEQQQPKKPLHPRLIGVQVTILQMTEN
jgi:hypothetical protein